MLSKINYCQTNILAVTASVHYSIPMCKSIIIERSIYYNILLLCSTIITVLYIYPLQANELNNANLSPDERAMKLNNVIDDLINVTQPIKNSLDSPSLESIIRSLTAVTTTLENTHSSDEVKWP